MMQCSIVVNDPAPDAGTGLTPCLEGVEGHALVFLAVP